MCGGVEERDKSQKGQNKPTIREVRDRSGQGQNVKRKQKAMVWRKKGFGNVAQEKGTMPTVDGASSSGSITAVALETNTRGHQNQNEQKKGPGQKLSLS